MNAVPLKGAKVKKRGGSGEKTWPKTTLRRKGGNW